MTTATPALLLPNGFGEFYTYSILLQADETLDKLKFDGDADFELQRLSCFFDIDGSPQTAYTRSIPQLNINLLDTATGRNLFSGFTSTAELFGDGAVPFILPTTHYFKRATEVRVLYDPVDPGPDSEVGSLWLNLIGRKHFDY